MSTNEQTLYNLVTHFIRKVPRDDEPDPNYQDGMEIIKQECKNIVDILEQDSETSNFRSLIQIYIPRTTGVADEDKPYLDWMEALIHDLLTARPMWQPVFKKPQTSSHILATAYAGIYNTPTNNEINGLIDLSMSMNSMDRVTRPWANTEMHTRQCFSEIEGSKLVVHISCTADDSKVDFTRNKDEEKKLFDFVWNMCSPGADRKLKYNIKINYGKRY